jgi:hypothetical protein
VPTRPFLTAIANTKVQQFAAEAAALDVGDMRDLSTQSRRYSLLICFLYQAQVQTRDELAEMLLKRMRRTTTAAQTRLKELQDQHRELEEQMLTVFAEVINETLHTLEDNAALGQGVRDILQTSGGAEALRDRYAQVSAYHNNNYRPLLWSFYSPYRAELFRLSHVLTFRAATQDQSLIEPSTSSSVSKTPSGTTSPLRYRSASPACAGKLSSAPGTTGKPSSTGVNLKSVCSPILIMACGAVMCMSRAPPPTPITGNSCCPGRSARRVYRPIAKRSSLPQQRQPLWRSCVTVSGQRLIVWMQPIPRTLS